MANMPIVGIPACGLYHQTTVFDLVLPRLLAGTAITDRAQDLKIVRHGGGTRSLKPVSCKVYCLTDGKRKALDNEMD